MIGCCGGLAVGTWLGGEAGVFQSMLLRPVWLVICHRRGCHKSGQRGFFCENSGDYGIESRR